MANPLNSTLSRWIIPPSADVSRSTFLQLPREIQLLIGEECEDEDLASLMGTCKLMFDVFSSMQTGLWRRRFDAKFDTSHHVIPANVSYYEAYIQRHRKTVTMGFMTRVNTQSWTVPHTVLIQLINECDFSGSYLESKNLAYIRQITARSEALDVVGRAGTGPRAFLDNWSIVQLVLLHLVLDVSRNTIAYCFPESCIVAYGNPTTAPLFHFDLGGVSFDVTNILAILNFFKTYICLLDHELREVMGELPPISRPQPWHRRFGTEGQVQELGQLWRGAMGTTSHANVRRVRRLNGPAVETLETEFIGSDEDLPQIFLSFDPQYLPLDDFPTHIIQFMNPYSTSPPCNRNQLPDEWVEGKDYALFVGTLRMYRVVQLIVGVLTPVPGQGGVSGWQRLVMLAYDDPAPGTTVNSHLAGYSADRLPAGDDPTDGGAAELLRYATPEGSALAKAMVLHGRDPAAARAEEATAVLAGNNDMRREHRELLDSHKHGEASRYYFGRPHRRPQLRLDLGVPPLPTADAVLAYEGLVLPGGNAVIGRWWDVEEDVDRFTTDPSLHGPPESWRLESGPFIFWNVDLGLSYDV